MFYSQVRRDGKWHIIQYHLGREEGMDWITEFASKNTHLTLILQDGYTRMIHFSQDGIGDKEPGYIWITGPTYKKES